MILVTGATGFTGPFVVRDLLARGHEVACFVRDPLKAARRLPPGVEMQVGSFEDAVSFRSALAGKQVLINIASLGFGHGPGIVKAIEEAGVRRAVFISTTAIFTTLPVATKEIRLQAEREIQRSSLDWTILRPTMIYGGPGDRNISRLVAFIRRSPVVPMVGTGAHLLQPILVDDLASAILRVLEVSQSVGRTYNLSGAEPLTYRALISRVADAVHREPLVPAIPVGLVLSALRTARFMGWRMPVTPEQILRLNEDKAVAHQEAAADFGFAPRDFPTGVLILLQRLASVVGKSPG